MKIQKTLYLLRHAKSSWKEAGLSDRMRPLNQRGLGDAPEMGRRLATQATQPQQIITSPALRAFTTATLLAKEIGLPGDKIAINDEIYMASASELLQIIRQFDQQTACIMLVGHNPGMTELVNDLTNSAIDNVPTCGIAAIHTGSDNWHETGKATSNLLYFDYPKNIA